MCRGIRQKQQAGGTEEALAEARAKLGGLEEQLSGLEGETREALLELLAEFDRRYSDLAETDRGHYTTFFATVRRTPPLPSAVQRIEALLASCHHDSRDQTWTPGLEGVRLG